VGASSDTFNFTFRGERIVSAVITSLVNTFGMGSTPGSNLLFGGCSAGAIGAMNNLDAVAAQVPPSLRVAGFFDAASLVDVRPTGWPWSNDLVPLQTLISDMVGVVQPTFEPVCAARYTGAAAWKCLLGQYRMTLVATTFFANIPQLDDFEMMYDSDNFEPVTPAQLAFVDSFQDAVLGLIAALPPGTGVFSPTCLVHCLSGQQSYGNIRVDWQNLSTALEAWYFRGQDTQLISTCRGWNCTSVCGATNNGVPCTIGTGYKATTCYPLQFPSITTEPGPASAPKGVPIPGDSSSAPAATTPTTVLPIAAMPRTASVAATVSDAYGDSYDADSATPGVFTVGVASPAERIAQKHKTRLYICLAAGAAAGAMALLISGSRRSARPGATEREPLLQRRATAAYNPL